MNGYFIRAGQIVKGDETFFEQGLLFSPDQLNVLCKTLNADARFDEMLYLWGAPRWGELCFRSDILPLWEQECEKLGIDATPPWRKTQNGKRCQIEHYDPMIRRVARCRKRATHYITIIGGRRMFLCEDHIEYVRDGAKPIQAMHAKGQS